jgi:Dolichyl-phosphate-mannose-protein mannosyltransferase
VTRRQEWVAVAALVLVSTGLRAWAALKVPVPWIAPDEMVYGLLGRSLYEHGTLDVLGGPTPFYSALTPALAGFPLSVFSLDTGYDVLRGIQPLVMSLAAVPVYLWARSLVSRRSALVAAALALAAPGLTYSGLVMTEVLFYPLFVLAAWGAAEAIARPTRRTQLLLVLVLAAVIATRLQAIVLLPAFATAALLDAGLARSWHNLRRLVPVAGGLVALVVVWVIWRVASGTNTLGGYEVAAGASYSVGTAAKFVVYHLASVLILCGLFPACAVALLLVGGLRRGEPDARVRAYLAVAASLTAWLVAEVGVFASEYSDRIVERNLIALGPVLFIGLVLWLERGAVGGYVLRSGIALAAAAVLLVLPVKRYVTIFGTHDAMTMIPLYKLVQASSPGTMLAVYSAVAGVVAVAFALLPRPALRVVPVVLFVAFAAASVVSSRFVAGQARAQQQSFLGSDVRWIDDRADGPVAYLYNGEPDWNRVWETLFWNERVKLVLDLAGQVPGPLPQTPGEVQPDGTVFLPPSAKEAPRFAVASPTIQLVGRRVAEAGLGLWRIDPPLRVDSQVEGLQGGGDIYATTRGRLIAYGCTHGTFLLTLIPKEPQTVEIRIDGGLVRRLEVGPPTIWRGRLPVSNHGGGRCTLDVNPTGLLGTTVFTFERG